MAEGQAGFNAATNGFNTNGNSSAIFSTSDHILMIDADGDGKEDMRMKMESVNNASDLHTYDFDTHYTE